MIRTLSITLCLLYTVAVCAQVHEEPTDEEDPTYQDMGTTYHVIKLIPIPRMPDEEVRTNRPSSGHIWVPGYWERTADDWRWVRGRWALPPEPEASWQAGHWRRKGDEWNWTTGGWIVTDAYDARKEVGPADSK